MGAIWNAGNRIFVLKTSQRAPIGYSDILTHTSISPSTHAEKFQISEVKKYFPLSAVEPTPLVLPPQGELVVDRKRQPACVYGSTTSTLL